MGKLLNRLTAFVLLLIFIASGLPLAANAQVRPIYDMGAIGLGQTLERLQTTASALHTGAHPDDEDSGLLAYLARGEHARTAYLALNRGEGGQNVIGPELFETLGVIRSEELLQARRLDGGQQFFTRVMDYGFSKKREEAARIWGEKTVLGDMVRAIRLFRPLVVIARFTGTPADGHGHHQLSGYLTPIAFKAAADPNQYPEQIAEGLRPWQAKKLYVSNGFGPNAANVPTLTVNPGESDSLIGRSYFEIAMEGRSQHKTQEMGTLELRGKQSSGMRLLEPQNGGAKESSVFDGLDTSIKGIAKLTNSTDGSFEKKLDELQSTAAEALAKYEPFAPQKIVPILAKGLKQARETEGATTNQDAKDMLSLKEEEFSRALQMAAGVVVDALNNSETIVGGDSGTVAVRTFAADPSIVKVGEASVTVPGGWTSTSISQPAQEPGNGFRPRDESAQNAAFFKVTVPANALLTQPYWLESPKGDNFNFDWSAPDATKNLPFQPALMTAEVKMQIGGVDLTVRKPVQYRYADDIRGELRRDINVVPLVSVALESNLLVVGSSSKPQTQRVVVSVANNAPRATSGTLKFELPSGWTSSPTSGSFDLKKKDEKAALAFDVTIPANAKPGDYKFNADAVVGGQTYNQTEQVIAYPHIQTHRRYSTAQINAKVLDLKVAPVRVGYIMGTGDAVPEAIRRMGLNVTMIEEKDLATGDLSKFDTIVVGIRASQARPDLIANNGRLTEFMNNGGTLIVQYQQSEYIQNNLPPYPAKMDSVVNGTQRISNVRVTDENAPVKILVPNHPVFNYPNKIGDDDWKNWIQERDLYCFTTLDPKYVPLLESHDEGDPESSGGMVYAEVGKGKYIYTAYSWFRQLPVGNAGAYRIFANMLSLPKAGKK